MQYFSDVLGKTYNEAFLDGRLICNQLNEIFIEFFFTRSNQLVARFQPKDLGKLQDFSVVKDLLIKALRLVYTEKVVLHSQDGQALKIRGFVSSPCDEHISAL